MIEIYGSMEEDIKDVEGINIIQINLNKLK